MNRDGALTSLWQDAMPEYKSKDILDYDVLYDVIIAGGGITGITTGLLLQKAGKKCLIAEANNICFGTTGGTTAHLNTTMDTTYAEIAKNFGDENAKLVAKAAKDAIALIKRNIEEYNISCGFEETTAYLYSQDEDQTKDLKEIHDSCMEVGVKTVYTKKIPIPVAFEKAIEVPGQAKFHPTQYVYALAKAFEEAGGTIVQHCRVNNVEENESTVTVTTDEGVLQCRQFIYATHIPPGINLLHLRCAPYRSYAMAVRLKNGHYPDGLAYDLYEPYHYHRTQKVQGEHYLIVGGEDHKTAHADNTEACFLKLESYIRKYYDVEEIAFKWSSQYFEPADGLPYIGHLPGKPGNIFVATGFGGNGMIYSNVAAMVLRDMIVNKDENYINLFNPNRIKPIAGFTNFVKENADVVKQLISKWFSVEKIKETVELAPGEGKVVKFDGHTIALYKDENSNLHAVNPVCTHMKCSVTWNIAEKSWDCPCHGARYSFEGKVLTGPADRDLEIVELKELVEEEQDS